jgi:hypothetical protein
MTITTHKTTAAARRAALALACLLAVALAVLAGASSAQAEFGLRDPFVAEVVDATGAVEERAGVTPYAASTSFSFREVPVPPWTLTDGNVKQIDIELPPGFIGNPRDLPKCTAAQFADVDPDTFNPRCPDDTAIGLANNTVNVGAAIPVDSPVYNLVPPRGAPAAFGFNALGVTVKIVAAVRPSDHGLTLKIRGISSSAPLHRSAVTFWGVPSDRRHDVERGRCAVTFEDPDDPWDPKPHDLCPVSQPSTKFLSNPVDCESGPLRTTFRARSWQEPDREIVAHSDTDHAPRDCGRLNFKPQIDVVPDNGQAGAPAGYTVRLTVPQDDDPIGAATPADPYDDAVTATLRDAVVTLPEGTAVSPSSADGLNACTPAQIGLGSDEDPACPAASKIGDVTIDSPLMAEPLTGGIFLAKPTDDQLLAIYLVAQGSGVTLKLPGEIDADPVTGRLTTSFLDNPQLPFSQLTLRFKGGPRAPLVNPKRCGPATTTAAFTPWSSDEAATASSSFEVSGCGDPGRFAPTLVAGVEEPTAGASSPFTLRLSRTDADQQLAQLSRVTMPPGLVGKVGTVPLCQEAAAAAGGCPASSRIGSATTASGAGASPLQIPGTVSLTTGYRGAPYGLSIAVPAKAGPFDLGLVVVRAAIHVNDDASLTVDADPLPTILKGIPLELRSIDLKLDRPGFMVNPTNCSPMAIGVTATSTAGSQASMSAPFRVGDCAALPFAPKITGTVGADRTDGASLHVRVEQTPGQANARSISVALPLAIAARMSTLSEACAAELAAAGTCPARTKLGEATAVSPVLARPLSGPAFLVRDGGRVPSLKVELRGEVAIDLIGTNVITSRQTITSTFGAIPDVPLSSFDLRLRGGSDSILRRIGSICSQDLSTPTVAIGQNGKRVATTTVLKPAGCKLSAKASAAASRRAVIVRANAPAAGRLVLRGATVKGAKRTTSRSGAVAVTLPLTARARRALARRGRVAVAVRATFTPRGGGAASAVTAKVTVKAKRTRGR